jgi:hypothetical protein
MMGIFPIKDPVTLAFVSLGLGLLFCFLGRKILPLIVILMGFAIGYSWGTPTLADLLNSNASWVPWVAGGIAAVLSVILWKVSVFFAGTIIALFVLRGLFPSLPELIHVVVALAFGLMVQLFRKPIISLVTALSGAFLVGSAVSFLVFEFGLVKTVGLVAEGSEDLPKYILWGVSALLTIVGYFFQMRKLED